MRNPSYITNLQGPTYTIPSMTADTTMQVYYKLKTYLLTVTYDEGADVSPHNITVQHGSKVNFYISAIRGYEILDVIFNGASKGILTEYTTPAIVGDSTLHVSAQPLYDFEVASVIPGSVRAGQRMFFSVKFTNDGIEHSAVPIDININGLILHTTAAVPERGEAHCFFDWTPATAGTYPVTINLNPGNVIEEKDYTNNTCTTSVTVLPPYAISTPDDLGYDDPDGGSPGGDPSSIPTNRAPIVAPSVPPGSNTDMLTWDENGTSYWARLSMNANITEPDLDPMRSGYGFSVAATTTVSHNYYNTTRIQEPEGIIMLLPEYNYDEGVRLEKMPDGTWQLPVNSASPTNARRWYIPANYGDGQEYVVLFQAFGAYTPAGELTAARTDEKPVRGSMYDDDITTAVP